MRSKGRRKRSAVAQSSKPIERNRVTFQRDAEDEDNLKTEGDDNGSLSAAVVAKKRPLDGMNELKRRIALLEQDNMQTRENVTSGKEKYLELDKKFIVIETELSVKKKNANNCCGKMNKKAGKQQSMMEVSIAVTRKTASLYPATLINVQESLGSHAHNITSETCNVNYVHLRSRFD